MNRTFIWTIFSLLLAILIGIVDYLTGFSLSFSPFYMIPISIMAWFTGKWGGIIGSFVCASIWLAADVSQTDIEFQGVFLFWNSAARLINLLIVGILVAILKTELDKQTEMAQMDVKTTALNYRAFRKLLCSEIIRSTRFHHPFTVVLFDLDNFKFLNDEFGHLTGDRVLRVIVEVCRRTVRQTDEVGRMDGDEFVLLFPETGEREAHLIVQRLVTDVHSEMKKAGWPVTLSIGLLTVLDAGQFSADSIIETVDHLQYEAKKNGKNAVVGHVIP